MACITAFFAIFGACAFWVCLAMLALKLARFIIGDKKWPM